MRAFNIVPSPAAQPAPRVITGRALERLCGSNNPAAAAKLAVDLTYGRAVLVRPTAEQSIAMTGTTISGYSAVRTAPR
jgi:hypothetical protein